MPLSIIGWRQDKTRKEVLTITNNMKPSYIKQKKEAYWLLLRCVRDSNP